MKCETPTELFETRDWMSLVVFPKRCPSIPRVYFLSCLIRKKYPIRRSSFLISQCIHILTTNGASSKIGTTTQPKSNCIDLAEEPQRERNPYRQNPSGHNNNNSNRKIKTMMKFFFSALVLFFCWSHTHALQEKQSGRAPQTAQVRRQDGLDHWDSDTLAYYLDNYPGYDAAVMFYASWDTNSQQLAPYWNQIAHGMDAGSSQSKIIMVSL